MTNNKNVKRSLLLSALSLLLCVSMLIGSTFAWFTDAVTSNKNQIIAGNLDVELEYKKVDNGVLTAKWETVQGKSDIFNPDALWEPGRVEVVYLKVSNLGTLALKYQLGVNFEDTVIGKAEDGKDIKLSEHLVFKVVNLDAEPTTPYTREDAITAAGTVKGLTDYNGTTTELAPKSDDPAVNDEDYVALIVYMPETVGNEANYRGTDVPQIELGINLFATQKDAESDSFGPDYDEDAIYHDVLVTTADELYAAVASATSGTVIAIDGNIVLNKALSKAGLENITFVAYDEDATIDQATYNMYFSGAKVTFKGLTLTHGEKAYGDGGQTSTAFAVWHAKEVNYIDCIFNRSVGTIHAPLHNFIGCTFNGVENPGNTKSEYPLYICDGQDYNVIDCVFNCTNRGAILFYNDGGSGTDTLNITNTKFLGSIIDGKAAVEIHNNSTNQVYNVNIKNATIGNKIENGLYRIKPANVGEVNVNVDGVTEIATVSSATDLNDAIASGKPIELTNDIQSSTAIKNDATINLAGNTFEATGTINLGNNADLTMTGGDYVANGTYGHIDVRPSTAEGSALVFEDVDFSYNKKNNTFGPSTDRLGTVVEVCATVSDAHTKIVFKNCTFTNAQVLFEGLSGQTGSFEAVFENCTFNALTSSAPIYVQNYVEGTITITGCTFNLECTSSSASAISVSPNNSTAVTVIAENNTINAVAATPYTYDESKGETSVDNIKVNGTPADIKFISIGGTTSTATETNTTKTGIAK